MSFEIKPAGVYAFNELKNEFLSFQQGLTDEEEPGIFTSSGGGVTHVTRITCDGNLIVFSGSDGDGRKVKVVQHFTQLNVQLVAVPKLSSEPRRIGF